MSEFLSRWSKRKRGEGVPEPVEAAPLAPPPAPEPETQFDITTLPDIDTATAATDFTAFLQKGVPEFLKRQALRRAWTLDPGIRDFVGPADYAWDFNAPDGVPGFALTLGGDIKKLLAQAIGELIEDEPSETPSFLPPGATMASAELPAPNAPVSPLRLAEAPAPAPELVHESPAESVASPRRHGSATPV